MRKKSRAGNGSILAAIIILILIGVAIMLFFNIRQEEQPPSKLDFSTDIGFLSFSKAVELPVTIQNNGGDANEVTVRVVSGDIALLQSSQVDVKGGATQTINIAVQSKDVSNGPHTAQFQILYRDTTGRHETPAKSFQFYVMPEANISDYHWQRIIGPLGEKYEIGTTDSTSGFLKITSQSNVATYSGLTLSVGFEYATQGLSITPSSQVIYPIGPQGKSQEYSFKIESKNAPPGKYTVVIEVLSDERIVDTHEVILTVKL